MRWCLALILLTSVASAEDEVPATHLGQFGLSARIGLGYRAIATYNSDYCGVSDTTAKNGDAPVCVTRSPFFLELEPSYGISKTIELTLGLHFGIESDFGPTATSTEAGPHSFRLEPGARFFFSETGRSKLFVQPSLILDFADYQKQNGSSYGSDFGVRANEGYWIDFHRSFGGYVFIGEAVEFARWLSADFVFGIGIQGRYP